MEHITFPLLLLACALILAASWTRCCDTDSSGPIDAGYTDAHSDAADTSLGYRMGCFPRYDGQQLYRSEVAPDGAWVCCEYRSLASDEPRDTPWLCGGLDEIDQDSPFFAVATR